MTGGESPFRRFPLLLKYLDAHRVLSVQVHPNDAQAALLQPPDLGKTEAWVILAADPGSVLYAGLRSGVGRADLEVAVRDGTVADLLHVIEPSAGDCFFIPAGTVHAIGAGLMVAEIQQASDVTFRLFDWNRNGPHGTPRRLDVEAALNVTDFATGPVARQRPHAIRPAVVSRLVSCPAFSLDRWTWQGDEALGGDDIFHLVTVLEGQVDLEAKESRQLVALSDSSNCYCRQWCVAQSCQAVGFAAPFSSRFKSHCRGRRCSLKAHTPASREGATLRKQAGRSDFVRAVGVSIIRAAGLGVCGTDKTSNAVSRVMRRRDRQ